MKTTLEMMLEKIAGPVAMAFSHQAEDAAVLRLLTRCAPSIRERLRVFTLDTRKLFPETSGYHEEAENFFGLRIAKISPSDEEIARLEAELGDERGIRTSVEHRKRCCRVRKVLPLAGALAGKSAWITGMRAAQSESRTGLPELEWDGEHRMVKLNPLAPWSDKDLADYIAEQGIPVHPLYEKGFKSIGCAPCTRAVKDGEDIRAGRWWWENGTCKECGLHPGRNGGA